MGNKGEFPVKFHDGIKCTENERAEVVNGRRATCDLRCSAGVVTKHSFINVKIVKHLAL